MKNYCRSESVWYRIPEVIMPGSYNQAFSDLPSSSRCLVVVELPTGTVIKESLVPPLPKGVAAFGGIRKWNGSFHAAEDWFVGPLIVCAPHWRRARKWAKLIVAAAAVQEEDPIIQRFKFRRMVRPGD